MNLLKQYGVTDRFFSEASLYPQLTLARVIAQYRGQYKLITEEGECLAEISGKLRYATSELAKFPAVGDLVMIAHENKQDKAVIHQLLTRKSVFLRTAVGVTGQAQTVAANIDIVFICMSLNQNFNLSRLERYLSVAWDSGAKPVILLTKADLCEDLDKALAQVESVSAFSDVVTVSMYDDALPAQLEGYFVEGVTAAFIGSSGVGKSTLINKLLGQAILETQEIGKADKGRHTTTGRELFPCPLGGVLIDTPGMRELGTESVDLSKSFVDMETLAQSCRFKNCSHTSEPGCALQKALADGLIDQRRLDNYFKLKFESSYEGLGSREIEAKKLERMFKEVGGMKNARKVLKANDKRR